MKKPTQKVYKNKFSRHLMGINQHLQTYVFEALGEECGYESLRIGYVPYFSMAARGGARLSDIADALAISRQAANQVADQIEAGGYLIRKPDANDGRAKLLVLTEQGQRMMQDGRRQALRWEIQVRELIDAEAIINSKETLFSLCNALDLFPSSPPRHSTSSPLASLLPPISNYCTNALMELTKLKGHPHLKPNFGQVFAGIGPEGGRIHSIARAQKVSKQSIGVIVNRLVELGYIEREVDALDARSQILQLTTLGNQLIADSMLSEEELRQRMLDTVGEEDLKHLWDTMADVYKALGLEYHLGIKEFDDIESLANQLFSRLSTRGARKLSELLARYAKEG